MKKIILVLFSIFIFSNLYPQEVKKDIAPYYQDLLTQIHNIYFENNRLIIQLNEGLFELELKPVRQLGHYKTARGIELFNEGYYRLTKSQFNKIPDAVVELFDDIQYEKYIDGEYVYLKLNKMTIGYEYGNDNFTIWGEGGFGSNIVFQYKRKPKLDMY